MAIPETTTGGRALKFYSSVRVDIRRIAAIKDGDVVTGSRTRVKVVKNKVAAPFREAEFDILYGEGISREGDLLDIAVNNNILEKSGSWFSYKGERIGQGRENARQFLKDNKDTMAKLDTEVRKALGLIAAPAPAHPAAVPTQAPASTGARVTDHAKRTSGTCQGADRGQTLKQTRRGAMLKCTVRRPAHCPNCHPCACPNRILYCPALRLPARTIE